MNIRIGILAILPVLVFAGTEPSDFRRLPSKRGYLGSSIFTYKEYQGWALVEGDILLAPLTDMRGAAAPAKSSPEKSATTVNVPYKVWAGGIVYYVIDPQMEDTQRIFDAMRHWEKFTPVRFQERTNQSVYVTFRPIYSGCNANVGATGNLGTVNLSSGCDLTATIHEIGHTLGLWHEQSRIDRDRWLRVRYENIIPQYRDQYDQQLLDGVDIGPYDFGSIMHYPAYGFTRNGDLTMESRPAGIPVGESQWISALDIQAIHKLYGVPMAQTLISSTPPGLKVLVDGQEHITPASFSWSDGEVHTISAPDRQTLENEPGTRYHSAGWSDGSAGEHGITVTAGNRVFDARFARYIQVAAGPGIEVTPPSDDGFYLSGSRVRLRAVPEPGLTFTGWSQPNGEIEAYNDFLNGAAPNPLDVSVLTPEPAYHARFAEGPVTTIGDNVPGQWLIVDDDLFISPVRFAWKPGTEHEIESLFYLGPDASTDYTFVRWPGSGDDVLKFTAPRGIHHHQPRTQSLALRRTRLRLVYLPHRHAPFHHRLHHHAALPRRLLRSRNPNYHRASALLPLATGELVFRRRRSRTPHIHRRPAALHRRQLLRRYLAQRRRHRQRRIPPARPHHCRPAPACPLARRRSGNPAHRPRRPAAAHHSGRHRTAHQSRERATALGQQG